MEFLLLVSMASAFAPIITHSAPDVTHHSI